MKLLRGLKMKLSKKIFAAAAALAVSAMVFVGCKGIAGNADDVDSISKREQAVSGKEGTTDHATYTRFYKEFGTSENVYGADCDITLTASNSKKAAAGFMFGLHTDKDSEKKKSAFVAAVRVVSGTPQFYVSHFSNFKDTELISSTKSELGTEDAAWSGHTWKSIGSGGYTYDSTGDKLSVNITVRTTSDGEITVRLGNDTVSIHKTDYTAFSDEVDVEKKQTKTKDHVIGKIASYGVIYPTASAPANKLTATWKVSNDKVTIGTLNAEVVEE